LKSQKEKLNDSILLDLSEFKSIRCVFAMAAPFFSTPFQPYVYQVLTTSTLCVFHNSMAFLVFVLFSLFGCLENLGKWRKLKFLFIYYFCYFWTHLAVAEWSWFF